MRILYCIIPVLLCGACSAPAPEPAVVVDSGTPTSSPARIADSAPPAPDVPLPPAIELPKESTCMMNVADPWPPSIKLRLSPGGSWFAEVLKAPVLVSFPNGKNPTTASAEATSEGYTVRGYFSLADVPIRARQAFAFGTFMVPTEDSALHILDVADGKLTLVMETPKGLQFVGAAPEEVRPCGDVTLGRGSPFQAEDFVAKVAKKDSFNIATDHPIDLSAEFNGPVVARITPEQFPDKSGYANQLYAFDKRGLKSRVFYYTDDELVFGWIATKELHPDKTSRPNYLGEGGAGGYSTLSMRGPIRVTCPKDVPLIAEPSPTERAVVATIPAGKMFATSKKESPLTKVWVNMGMISLRPDINFKVRGQDIADCSFVYTNAVPPK